MGIHMDIIATRRTYRNDSRFIHFERTRRCRCLSHFTPIILFERLYPLQLEVMMMMIAPNSRAGKGGKEGEYGGTWGVEEGNVDYGRMVQPSQ